MAIIITPIISELTSPDAITIKQSKLSTASYLVISITSLNSKSSHVLNESS
jgi:hypothetical protein